MNIIDVHAHVVPEHFPAAPADEVRWPCMCHGQNNTAQVMISDKPFREIDHRSWDAKRRIEDMDTAEVARQALSPMPELLSYWFSPATGLEMCKWMNHTIGEMITGHPDRFSGLGIVPLQDPHLAATYLAEIKQAGFAGIEIGSNINTTVLGDARFHEFYAEAERLELSIFVHALHPIGADRVSNTPDLIPFAAFPLDTALSAISLIRAGVPEKYPTLKFGFSHGGGAIVPLSHRLGKGAEITEGFNGTLTKSPLAYAQEFFYDNLVYDQGYAAYLANEFAPGQIFCGTDYPYTIMEDRPAHFIDTCAVNDPDSVRYQAASKYLHLLD